MMENIERIKRALAKEDCKAMLISSPINRLFATGFSSSAGILLVTDRDAWFFTDFRYITAAEAAVSKHAKVILITKQGAYTTELNKVFAENGISAVGFEEGAVTYAEYREWGEKLTAELRPNQKLLDTLRAVKSENDIAKMKAAERIAEKSFEEILPIISTDMTEKQLAAELIYRMLKNGADDVSFSPIVVSGERSSLPHGVPGDRKIEKSFLTIDFGVKLDGWCSDTTRTLCIGQPSDEMVKVYDTVLRAQEAGIAAARVGIAGEDIDKAARTVIEDAGFGDYFGHGFGHGIGMEVHEFPRASPGHTAKMPNGAVISAEPGIYLPGKFGVRIEDVIYITENGCENITNLPKKLLILE
ncbi:MAG: aminopeptidase P family protein [Oscillospiraceae bacterium]|nr:aminopeptidase P family protein [Oscillospiraceae bacterium]